MAANAKEDILVYPHTTVGAKLGVLPIGFEENQGQASEQFDFVARAPGYVALIGREKFVIRPSGRPDGQPLAPIVLQTKLVGSAIGGSVQALDRLPGKINYLGGRHSSRRLTGIRHYARVRYEQVYPGIDLIFHIDNGLLRFDFVVEPGATVSQIKLQTAGASRALLDGNGNLVLTAGDSALQYRAPKIFQYQSNGGISLVDGGFLKHDDGYVGFRIASYDKTKPLIIDPTLEYSTYLGGIGDPEQPGGSDFGSDIANGIVIDRFGSAYVTGRTNSPNFPTENAVQGAIDNSSPNEFLSDAFVAKLSPNGGELVYATYLGGAGFDVGNAIALDNGGHAYVAGTTRSQDDFLPGALHRHGDCGASDNAFVAKLSPDGAAVIFSAILCGDRHDNALSVAVDSLGQATVVGETESEKFPTKNCNDGLAFCSLGTGQHGFDDDAFVTKLSKDGASLIFSTFISGGGDEVANGVVIHPPTGNIFVVGTTDSLSGSPFALPMVNALFPNHPSLLRTGFVIKIDPTGKILFLTHLGGSTSDDEAKAVDLDVNGNVYVTGAASSSDFPLVGPVHNGASGMSDVATRARATDSHTKRSNP